jgi:nitrogen fixation protein FixH
MTRTFKGWHMAAITISFFSVIITVNVTLAVFAKSSWTGLVVENSYVASQSFNHDAEIAKQQQAVGWQMGLDVTRNAAIISIHDHANQPLHGLNVRLLLQRPTDDAEDKKLNLRETLPGLYTLDNSLGAGVWIADVTAEGNDHKPVRFVQRIFVK